MLLVSPNKRNSQSGSSWKKSRPRPKRRNSPRSKSARGLKRRDSEKRRKLRKKDSERRMRKRRRVP